MALPDDEAIDKVHKAMAFKYGEKVTSVASEIAEEFAFAISMKAKACQINRTALLYCASETISAIIRLTKEEAQRRDEERKRN